MKYTTQFRESKAIEAEACAWIAQLDGGEPSQEDLAALREWMNRSPAHRRAIEQMSTLWDDLNIFTELAVPRPAPARPARRRPAGGVFHRLGRPLPAVVGGLLVAAAVFLAVDVSEHVEPPDTFAPTAAPAAALQAGNHETGIGQQQAILLADGSRVTLNTDSRIEIDLTGSYRDIRLIRGEAMFEVAHEAARPFRVYAGNGLVRAIGTSFTVYLREPDNVSVTVAQGEVELATLPPVDDVVATGRNRKVSAAPLAKIRAGQSATFGAGIESIETLEHAELSRQLSWRDGMLDFDGEPLSEVVREVSRYTTQTIVILDPALRDLRIGGYFKVGETDAMFEALESSFGVRVQRINEDLVHLGVRR